MSKRDPKVTLQQLIIYAQRVQALCMDRTLDELLADWQTTWTFERAMQLLGEAVKRLPRELCNRYPAVDWKAIAGMRDNITHGYDSIDYEILWKAVQTQVPELLMTLNQMLDDLKDQ
ncbi:MAG TPA: HepT-like ribonuclease domain-containing protein [Gallionella sp.]|nr:HepT-like ribonuclease domain-containing protein [Gallionella sp.]